MGEILGIGCTHRPVMLRQDEHWTSMMKASLDDPDMVKTELIGLAEQPETLIKIDVGRLFFRPDIREKVNPDFHRGLSITEVDKATTPNDNTKP